MEEKEKNQFRKTFSLTENTYNYLVQYQKENDCTTLSQSIRMMINEMQALKEKERKSGK